MRKAINHLKKADGVLAAIIERVGPFKMEYREPTFQVLVRSIVSQQLSGKAAMTIFRRLKEAAKADPIMPESILKLRPAKMRALGLSQQKTGYIRELARLTRAGELVFEHLPALEDAEVIERLTRVKGVGAWTAHMFLIFALRRPNVLPTGDYGIQMAIKKHYKKRKMPKPEVMAKIAKSWEPYRSVACWYLWRSLDIKTM